MLYTRDKKEQAYLRAFDLRVAGMPRVGVAASFSLDENFFRYFYPDTALKGQLTATVRLYPQGEILQLDCYIDGKLQLQCDRTLALFDYPIALKNKVQFAFGPEEMVVDDQAYVIKYDAVYLNVAQHIYDFIKLAEPMRKIAPAVLAQDAPEGVVYTATSEDE